MTTDSKPRKEPVHRLVVPILTGNGDSEADTAGQKWGTVRLALGNCNHKPGHFQATHSMDAGRNLASTTRAVEIMNKGVGFRSISSNTAAALHAGVCLKFSSRHVEVWKPERV